MFEPLEMSKSMLVDGMVGIDRSGSKYVWLKGKFRSLCGKDYLDDVNEDLTNGSFKKLDMVKVCETKGHTLVTWALDENLTVIWERKETVRLTIDQIKEKLGIDSLKILDK